jgi:hypothetical protein
MDEGTSREGAAVLDHRGDDGAVHVGTVDVDFAQREALSFDVLSDGLGPFLFGPVRGRDRAGEDRRHIQIPRDVLLVAIEAFRATLATVAHLRVFDRDPAILGDTLPDAHVALDRLEVLVTNRRGQAVRERSSCCRLRRRFPGGPRGQELTPRFELAAISLHERVAAPLVDHAALP